MGTTNPSNTTALIRAARRFACIAALVAVVAGCPGTTGPGDRVSVSSLTFAYVEGTEPILVGNIRISNSRSEVLRYTIGGTKGGDTVADGRYLFDEGLTGEVPSGETAVLPVRLAQAFTADVIDTIPIDIRFTPQIGPERQIEIDGFAIRGRQVESSELDASEAPLVAVGGATFPGATRSRAIGLVAGQSRPNFNPSVPSKEPEPALELIAQMSNRLTLTDEEVAQILDAGLVCGDGPNGFGVCASTPGATPAGPWLVFAMVLAEAVALDDAENLYEYAFAFDADGVDGNNFTPESQVRNDPFRATDRWYALKYDPNTGWRLDVTDASGEGLTFAASGARSVINENVIVLIVPASEFGTDEPEYRVTTFRHVGDFGQLPGDLRENEGHNWSGDFHPDLTEPLFTGEEPEL